jgi:hypothetical protein
VCRGMWSHLVSLKGLPCQCRKGVIDYASATLPGEQPDVRRKRARRRAQHDGYQAATLLSAPLDVAASRYFDCGRFRNLTITSSHSPLRWMSWLMYMISESILLMTP